MLCNTDKGCLFRMIRTKHFNCVSLFSILLNRNALARLHRFNYTDREVPEGVSDAVMEVQKAFAVAEQQVSSVEINVPSFEHIPEQLLLRLDLVPSVAQELVHGCQRSYQDPCLSCAQTQDAHPHMSSASVHAAIPFFVQLLVEKSSKRRIILDIHIYTYTYKLGS